MATPRPNPRPAFRPPRGPAAWSGTVRSVRPEPRPARPAAGWVARGVLGVAVALAGLALVALPGCGRSGPTAAADDGRTEVLATIQPLAGIVREVAPEGVPVDSLVPAGQSEHGYQLTAADVSRIARADVVVRVGLGLEQGLDAAITHVGAARPGGPARVVTFADVVGIEGVAACDEPHDHASHAGAFVDPHLWLDPALVRRLVPAVADALGEALAEEDPARGEELRAQVAARSAAFVARVDAIDRLYRERLSPFVGQAIVTHHAAFGRLAERYGLRVAAVLRPVATGEPTPADVDAAVRAIRGEGARAVFTEPQYDRAFAARIAQAAGVRLATLDPLGAGDWEAMMRSNLDALVDALAEDAGEAASGG